MAFKYYSCGELASNRFRWDENASLNSFVSIVAARCFLPFVLDCLIRSYRAFFDDFPLVSQYLLRCLFLI